MRRTLFPSFKSGHKYECGRNLDGRFIMNEYCEQQKTWPSGRVVSVKVYGAR